MCIIYLFMNGDVYILVSKHSIKIHQKKNMLVGGHIQNYQIHLKKINEYILHCGCFSHKENLLFLIYLFFISESLVSQTPRAHLN
jgi:hypothetical protein